MKIFTYTPPPGLPTTIWQDKHYLAIDKPSGLLSNPGRAEVTHDCALSRLQAAYGEVFLVHRLDCDTSGILVFAKNKKAEGALKKQLQERDVKKTYQALVMGTVAVNTGIITEPLAPNPEDRPLQKVSPNGKEALTQYQVMGIENGNSRLQLTPLTGRTHQLRVHLNHIGHPILGDTFYGDEVCRGAASRLCLHAQKLTFKHFETGNRVELNVDTPF